MGYGGGNLPAITHSAAHDPYPILGLYRRHRANLGLPRTHIHDHHHRHHHHHQNRIFSRAEHQLREHHNIIPDYGSEIQSPYCRRAGMTERVLMSVDFMLLTALLKFPSDEH